MNRKQLTTVGLINAILIGIASILIIRVIFHGLFNDKLADYKILFSVLTSFVFYVCIVMYLLNFQELKCFVDCHEFNIKKSIAYGSVGGVSIAFLQFPYTIIVNKDIQVDANVFIGSVWLMFLFCFLVVVAIPVVEEIFFRLVLFDFIKDKLNIFWKYLLVAILFGGGHSNFSSHFVALVLSSLVLTYIYDKTRLIQSSILAHVIWNFTWFSVVYARKLYWVTNQ